MLCVFAFVLQKRCQCQQSEWSFRRALWEKSLLFFETCYSNRLKIAQVVKLVDTPASGAGDRKVVEVQVFSWVPSTSILNISIIGKRQ